MYAATIDYSMISARRPEPAGRRHVRRLLIGSAAFLTLAFGLAQAVQGSAVSSYETVTVRQGDTLWAIAADRYPGSNVGDRVDQIERANGLKSAVIHPGQLLRVPAS